MIRRVWRVETTVFLCLWSFFMVAGRSSLLRDPGTFWHIVVGRQILASGQFIEEDRFSCTAYGEPWIAGHWLAECAMAAADYVGGLDTVLLAAATLLAGLYTWVAHRFMVRGVRPVLAVLFTLLTIAASSYHFHARTHLATIALLGWTFARLVDFEAGRIEVRSLFWLIPVFAFWTNAHAGVIGGVATLAITVAGWWLMSLAVWGKRRLTSYSGNSLADGSTPVAPIGNPSFAQKPSEGLFFHGEIGNPSYLDRGRWALAPRQVLLTGLLVTGCALAAVCHPYGLRVFDTWFGLMASPVLPVLMEEHRPLLESPERWVVLSLAAVYVFTLVGTAPRLPRVTWLVPLVWLVLTFGRIRHGPLFAVTAAIAIAEMLPNAGWVRRLASRGSVLFQLRTEPRNPQGKPSVWPATIVPVAIVLTALICQSTGLRVPIIGAGWARLDPTRWPIELLPELRSYERRSSQGGTPVFNEMLFGGFLIYYTPGLNVFIDDRCELYGEDRLREYLDALARDAAKVDKWADQFGFEIALTISGSRFDEYCKTSPRWEMLRRSDAATLYRRVPDAPSSPRDAEQVTRFRGPGLSEK